MANVNDIPTKVREATKRGQDAVSDTVKGWSETVSKLVPEVTIPFAQRVPEFVPQAKAAVNSAFDVAEQAVSRQREFVIGALDSVGRRFSELDGKKSTPKKASKSSTKASKSTEASTDDGKATTTSA